MRKLSIINLTSVILASLLLSAHCYAQTSWPPGEAVQPKYGFPGRVCAVDMPSFMANEGGSSGDGHSGWVYSWDVVNQCFQLRPPALLTGPSAMPSNMALTQNVFTPLDSAIGAGGFRSGLAQYPPQGVYIEQCKVSFATPTPNSTYELEMTLGNTAGSGSQSQMLVGSPTQVGGGVCTSPGASNLAFQCSVASPQFSCLAPYGWACEVRISVFTSDASGAALGTSTHITSNNVSSCWIERVRGLNNLQ